MENKTENIVKYIKSHGYKNVSDFAHACEIDPSNIWKNVKGIVHPDIKRLFRFAKALRTDIDSVVYLFYPDEYIELACFLHPIQ